MNYTINLKDAKSGKPSLLMLVLRSGKERMKISTGISVLPDEWDNTAQAVRKSCTYHNINNGILLKWKQAANETLIMAQNSPDMGLCEIKDAILAKMGKASNSQGKDQFLPYYDKWSHTTTTRRIATRQMAYSFRLFSEYIGYRNPSFTDITSPLIEGYIEWMAGKGLSANTRGCHVKRIKSCMKDAYDEGLHENMEFSKFRKETEKVENVYLTEEEIRSIEQLQLVGVKADARDMFVIGCRTALRFSDCSRLSVRDIDANGMIRIKQQKTDAEVIIPCHPKVKEILERNGGRTPYISLTRYNYLLKDICREAGICEVIGIRRHGSKDKEYHEKWELVSSHTARRSAATNMYKAGIPTVAIMKITGHSSEKIFLDYIKVAGEENAEMLKSHPFFNPDIPL